jgi:cytochrome c oxidase cbb3-type subunit 3
MGDALGGDQGVKEVAEYVRSLSSLKHDAKMAAAGAPKFAVCAACHGADAKGNRALGAPNLSDNIWLYGSSAEDTAYSIKNGRGANQLVEGQSAMPAQGEKLGPAKIHLLTAYVWGLGGGEPPAATEPAAAPAATAVAPPAGAPAAGTAPAKK